MVMRTGATSKQLEAGARGNFERYRSISNKGNTWGEWDEQDDETKALYAKDTERFAGYLVPEDARIIGLGLLVRARAALDLMPVRKEIKDELDALIAGDAS